MLSTERETTLYKELLLFPTRLAELLAIQDDAYGIMLSSPLLSHQNNISRGKKSLGGSRVERLVVKILTSSYVTELELYVASCRALYEDSIESDRTTLLRLWRGEDVDSFPPRLLYRYSYLKEEIARVSHGQEKYT